MGRREVQRGKVLAFGSQAGEPGARPHGSGLGDAVLGLVGDLASSLCTIEKLSPIEVKPEAGPQWPGPVGGGGGSLAPSRRGGQVSSPHPGEGGDWKSRAGGLFLWKGNLQTLIGSCK